MHPVLQQQDKMCARRFGAPNVEKDSCRADKYSEATKNAKVGACRHDQGPQKTGGLPLSEVELPVLYPHGWTYQDTCLRDGEVEGSRGEDGGHVGMADEVGGGDGNRVGWGRVREVRGQRREGVNGR